MSDPAPGPTRCLLCGEAAGGTKRVAIWEEEEKGRLGARPVVLCDACHARFLAGVVTRVDVGRAYHAAKHYEPHGWIGRIDRDRLLDIVCLNCGVLLPLGSLESAAQPPDVKCRECASVNRFARRGEHWITAEIVP